MTRDPFAAPSIECVRDELRPPARIEDACMVACWLLSLVVHLFYARAGAESSAMVLWRWYCEGWIDLDEKISLALTAGVYALSVGILLFGFRVVGPYLDLSLDILRLRARRAWRRHRR